MTPRNMATDAQSPNPLFREADLRDLIDRALWLADHQGHAFVAIHLNQALEALKAADAKETDAGEGETSELSNFS